MLFLSVSSPKPTSSALYITLLKWLKVLIGRDTFTSDTVLFSIGDQ